MPKKELEEKTCSKLKSKHISKSTDELQDTQIELTRENFQKQIQNVYEILKKRDVAYSSPTPRSSNKKREENTLNWLKQVINSIRFLPTHEQEDKIDWFIEEYHDPNKNEVKYIIQQRLLPVIKELYSKDPDAAYRIFEKTNRIIPEIEVPLLSFDPNLALYGSAQKNSSLSYVPMSNQEIIERIQMFLNHKNGDCFARWVLAILQSDKTALTPTELQNLPGDKREEITNWINEQLINNDAARELFTVGLLDTGVLQEVTDKLHILYCNSIKLQQVRAECESVQKDNQELQQRIQQLSKQIDEKNHEIQNNTDTIRKCEFDKIELTNQLKRSERRRELQILENERLVEINEQRLDEAELLTQQAQDEKKRYEVENLNLRQKLENIQADLDFTRNELSTLEQKTQIQRDKSQEEMLKKLVGSIAESLSDLQLAELVLREEFSKLNEQDTICDLTDTITNITDSLDGLVSALNKMGIHPVGQLNAVVPYDTEIHTLIDGSGRSGELVKVQRCGWKIGDKVYKKAEVEKEFEKQCRK